MLNRSRRYAMLVEDGVVTTFHLEQPGVCEVSTGEAMLAEL
jgi:glutaredoxin/glutathione-dependent peroxiredoxin